jgi:hypothetical protein
MIKTAYIRFIAIINETTGELIEQSSHGDRVLKKTWLYSSEHFWQLMQQLLLMKTDSERNIKAEEIREEIKHPVVSELVQEFHKTNFPDVPIRLINVTWQNAGKSMTHNAALIFKLSPGKEKTSRWNAIDNEFLKLKTQWVDQSNDSANN